MRDRQFSCWKDYSAVTVRTVETRLVQFFSVWVKGSWESFTKISLHTYETLLIFTQEGNRRQTCHFRWAQAVHLLALPSYMCVCGVQKKTTQTTATRVLNCKEEEEEAVQQNKCKGLWAHFLTTFCNVCTHYSCFGYCSWQVRNQKPSPLFRLLLCLSGITDSWYLYLNTFQWSWQNSCGCP